MKNNLKRLSKILQLFGYDAFYNTSIGQYTVHLQGAMTPETLSKAKNLKFRVCEINDNGFIKLVRGEMPLPLYEITLT